MTRKPSLHPEEAELIQRLRIGDQRAQNTIVRQYNSALMNQAFRVLRDEALAKDAVQDSWLAAFRCIDRFDGRSSLFTWLVRIVINTAKSRRRHERRSIPFSVLVSPRGGSGVDGTDRHEGPETAVETLTPEWLLLHREAVTRFDSALRALPAGQRSVVVMRDLEGASSAEACRTLKITDLTQRVRLSRARATLRLAVQKNRRLVA